MEQKDQSQIRHKFWESISLREMNQNEWEALCDRCGQCCLHKLEDEETGEVYTTRVVCRLFDNHKCCCRNYAQRAQLVPACKPLSCEATDVFFYLPETCAYRILSEGRLLAWWHPLISGNQSTVHEAGISIKDKAISENLVNMDHLEDFVDESF
ncbi:MAG: YcgN family cysteine cluster protein [Deltaproteobacteria bacterium]|nr:YcgN family cysteine cluster protein [Deltaproteobacteria bacterium]